MGRRRTIKETPTPQLVVVTVVLLVILLWFVGGAVEGGAGQIESSDWPQVSGTVTRSTTEWHKLFSRRLLFTCEYTVDGRQYAITRPRLAQGGPRFWFGGYGRFVEAHPVGSTMAVCYDPRDPSRGTTSPGLGTFDILTPLFISVVLLVLICRCVVVLVGRVYGHADAAEHAP